ncbi:ATP-dependent metallopeptidase FtsH/Yme1/Tma family protein [Dendrosporobacter sp. 1207_IL3150]|uniref:ATP-dependent metallopeptidase FtsH/Yme1/Tma family protein n=1 Tax=Dendrosporobacter sp. 1207_IL3150 TaxID=3084054 RepID=UPI002FDA8242
MQKVKVEHSFPFLRTVFIGGLCFLILIIGVSLVDYYYTSHAYKHQEEVTYTQFLKQVDEQKVSRVAIEHNKMIGVLKNGQVISTNVPVSVDLIEKLKKNNVEYQF